MNSTLNYKNGLNEQENRGMEKEEFYNTYNFVTSDYKSKFPVVKQSELIMLTIRKAAQADAPSIIDFQLKMAWETERIKLVPETVTKGVNAVFLDPSKGQYFVAESDGILIASLLITNEWSDWRNKNVWWFQSVYVVPEFRRQGIFRKMYTYIREQADKNGIAGLRLYVETKNERAKKTYEALGMSSEHYSFYEWMRE